MGGGDPTQTQERSILKLLKDKTGAEMNRRVKVQTHTFRSTAGSLGLVALMGRQSRVRGNIRQAVVTMWHKGGGRTGPVWSRVELLNDLWPHKALDYVRNNCFGVVFSFFGRGGVSPTANA